MPTLKELGYNVPPVNQLFFASTSPGVPADRVALLRKTVADAVAQPDFAEKMKMLGNSVTPLTPERIKEEHNGHRAMILEFKEDLKR